MYEAKQMTTGQPVGAASHTAGGFSTAVRIGDRVVSGKMRLANTLRRYRNTKS
jgi:hypothetical protein